MVEHDLAKVGAAGSSPVSRSQEKEPLPEWVAVLFSSPILDSKVRVLRSTPVGATLRSPGPYAPSRALKKRTVTRMGSGSFFESNPGLEGSSSPFHSGRRKAKVPRTLCAVSRS